MWDLNTLAGRRKPDPPEGLVVVVHSTAQERGHLIAMGVIAAALAALYPLLARSAYRSSPDLHAAMEVVGSVIGLVAGLALVVNFAALGNRFHLLVGLAFFVNGAEDLVHGLLAFCTHHGWGGIPQAALDRFIPGTYVAGRMLLGITLLLATIFRQRLGRSPNPRQETIRASLVTTAVVISVTLLASGIPLPAFVFPDRLIARPVDLLSALVMLAALLGLVWEYHQRRHMLTGWIALSVCVNMIGQVMMSFSKTFFDPFFDVAHVCKILGYVAPLIGFCLRQTVTIADRQWAEWRVQTLHQQIEFILGATRTGLDIIDSDFNIRYVDPQWTRIYGDWTGRKCYEYFMDRREVCPGCGIVEALTTRVGVVTEEVLPKEGGRPVQVTSIPFQDATGQWLVAEVNVDITERKKAEEDLARQLAELERFNRLAVGRERRMIEMKGEVNELLRLTGQAEKYIVPPETGPVDGGAPALAAAGALDSTEVVP